MLIDLYLIYCAQSCGDGGIAVIKSVCAVFLMCIIKKIHIEY